MLDEAKSISDNNNAIVRWSRGIVFAQLPDMFGKRNDAINELKWLSNNPDSEPLPGFYREVYRQLANLYADDEPQLAQQYLLKSGYDDYQPEGVFIGAIASTRDTGLLFAPSPRIDERIKGRLFTVYGFGFSDIHFVVSANGKELIIIDAGTQPFSMKAAYEFLLKNHPMLPPLTTSIITHAHWDHIGGYTYLKQLNPDIKFYGRDNFHPVVHRVKRNHRYQQFRSVHYQHTWVEDYKPDITINQTQHITIGGSKIELIPVSGGETEDALLINFENLDTIFVGDVLMPYYGEPTVEEGFIDAAINTMDEIIKRDSKHVLHGHYGLTYMYGSIKEISIFKDAYTWLVEETRRHLENGYSVDEIMRLNLIPPGLQKHPTVFMGYLTPRNHIIARLADHMLGIWQENSDRNEPKGITSITATEYGRMLQVYLELSAAEVANMLDKMIAAGDFELAIEMAVAAEKRYPGNSKIIRLKQRAADKNRNKGQFIDPFRFVFFTEMTGKEHKPMPLD